MFKKTLLLSIFCFLILNNAYCTVPGEDPGGMIIAGVTLLEIIAAGSGLGSSFEYGDEAVGGILVTGGVLGLIMPHIMYLFQHDIDYRTYVWPEFTIPYTVCLIGLGAYNLWRGNEHSGSEKFWINFIGLNACIAIPVIITALIDNSERKK